MERLEGSGISLRSSSGIGLVHQRDFARDGSPLQFAAKRFVASLTLVLFPLEQFIRESKMRLDYYIKTPGPHKAAGIMLVSIPHSLEYNLLSPREGKTHFFHNFGDANSRRA